MATHAPIMGAGKRAPKMPENLSSPIATLRALRISSAPWLKGNGERPNLPGHVFVYVRFSGESREEAEAYRDGYGQSVDSVHDWAEVIEYRHKHLSEETAGEPTMSVATPIAALRALPPGTLAAKWRQLERQWEDLDRVRRLADLFAAFDKDDMELGAELLIAEMDARAGDPDLEPNGDELDHSAAEDDGDCYAFVPGPGCPISDPGEDDYADDGMTVLRCAL